MRQTGKILFFAILTSLAVSCGGNDPAEPDPKPGPGPAPVPKVLTHEQQLLDDGFYHDVLKDGWEKETKARANLMLLKWSPLKTLPSTVRDVKFNAGETVTGIPYSSLFNEKGLLAENVSFHTFLSTLANPKSLMYTTDYRKSTGKYDSKCTYDGTQGTGSIQFAWGLPFHQGGTDIYNGYIPYIKKLATVDMQDLEIFDGILYSDGVDGGDGHMMMVYDIMRDKDGKMVKLVIFEAAHPTVRLTTYTPKEYRARLDEQTSKSYFFRLDRENYSDILRLPDFVEQSTDHIDRTFPTAVCPDRGDKVSYALGTPVVLNILSENYSKIELYKDDALYGEPKDLAGTGDVTYENLPVGNYKACLASGSGKSDFTSFEVADPTFTPSLEGNKLYINCEGSSYEPLFISCNVGGSYPVSTRLQLRKVSEGKWVYEGSLGGATHVRAHFACKYSSVSGQSIRCRR